MSTFFKHSYVVVIIKHDLEIRRADQIFSRLLDINIETLYVSDLNECVRFFGFVAQKVTLCNRSRARNANGVNDGEQDENTNVLDSTLMSYLGDSQRVVEILANIPDLNEDEAYTALTSFKTIKGLSNASTQDMVHCLPFDSQQIKSIYDAFRRKPQQ